MIQIMDFLLVRVLLLGAVAAGRGRESVDLKRDVDGVREVRHNREGARSRTLVHNGLVAPSLAVGVSSEVLARSVN